MSESLTGLSLKSVAGAIAALAILSAGSVAAAAGGSTHALSAPACGMTGGSLADPAETQACLAERYKAPKPKSAKTSPPSAPSTAASATPSNRSAASANTSPPAAQGQ